MTSLNVTSRRRFAERRSRAHPYAERRFSVEAPPGRGTRSSRHFDPLTRNQASAPRYILKVFGGPSMVGPSGSIRLSPLQGALLGVLSAHGQRGIDRERLLALLWPPGPEGDLQHRLNQVVYTVRDRTRGDCVIHLENGQYSLDQENVGSDLEDYFSALAHRSPRQAAGLVEEGFLSAIRSVPTVNLEGWIRERHLRFRAEVRTLAVELWSEAEQRADWGMAEEAAEVLLELAPDDEALLRKLLQSKALRGKVREAEAAYRGYLDLANLERPDWEPSEETTTLVSRLGELAEQGRSSVALRPSSPSDHPLMVGREEEFEKLINVILHPPQDGMATVAVHGEGGIGKTRLVEEALARAPFQGVRVLTTSCSEFAQRIPMGALLGALGPQWVGQAIGDLPSPWGPILLSLLPELATEEDLAAAPSETPTEEVPRVTCEAFLQLLERLARPDPLVLFIDDVQWLDATSLAILQHLRSHWEAGALILLVTIRPESLAHDSAIRRWLTPSQSPADGIIQVRLNPLEEGDIKALITSVWDRESPDQAISPSDHQWIEATSAFMGGHPLLALEYTRHHLARGSSDLPGTRLRDLPEAIRSIATGRTSRLSEGALNLVQSIAPSEKPLPYSILEAISEAPPQQLPDFLDEALTARLVRISPGGVEFCHGLLREALLGELSGSRRALAHRRIGEALADLEDPGIAMDIALHLLAAGEGPKARPFVLQAARTAIDSGGWSESRNLLQTALDGEQLPGVRGQLASLLGQVLVLSGEFSEGAVAWREAEAAFQQAGMEDQSLTCCLRHIEARSLAPGAQRPALLEELRELRTEGSERHAHQLVAECMSAEVALLDRLRRVDEVRGVTADAAARTETGDRESELHFLLVSLVDAVYGEPERAESLADRAVHLARETEDPDLTLRALNWKLIALYQQAKLNLDEGQELIGAAKDVSHRSKSLEARYWLELNIGVWHMDSGDQAAAKRSYDRADKLLRDLSAPHLRRVSLTNRGQLALEEGDALLALTLFNKGLYREAVAPWEAHRCTTLAGMALAHLHIGHLKEAREIHAELPDKPDTWTFDPYLWLSLDARLDLASGTATHEVLETLEGHEHGLKETAATTWIRLRILRLEIGLRRHSPPALHHVRELMSFLEERRIHRRQQELKRLLKRSGIDV
jgi:DNA-binding SARP family transcriptional activator/tetratricopeptide (TPR) repeat protein